MSAPLLTLHNASKRFGKVTAVVEAELSLNPGIILAIVGGSGSGKSTVANLLLGLEKPTTGVVEFEGRNILALDRGERLAFRAAVQMVFQDPFASLNPRMTIGQTVCEPLTIHRRGDRESRLRHACLAMEEAELRPAEAFFNRHPHELSGGQRQRAAIARAIVLHPRVLVADEPVSMLDVSVRAGILNLFKRFAREHGMAIVFITHDLSLIAHLCDEVAVMHRGLVLEQGSTRKVLSDPEHAYTRRLIDAVPRIRSCTAVSHSGSERTDGSPNRF